LDGLFSVGNTDKRTQTYSTKTLSGEGEMAQAKTLTQAELDQVLRYVSTMRYGRRNRAMVLTSFWSGMRVGEIAALRICDVRNEDGTIKQEVRLTADQTKGKHPRTVFLNEKLRTELKTYVSAFGKKDAKKPLFFTEKRAGFDANTLAQWFHWLYKKAGIAGASSHSGRRTYATTIASKGTSLRVLMRLMGHRSPSTTAVYIDANDNMLREAVELA
jgi:integrase/recombinase XerD